MQRKPAAHSTEVEIRIRPMNPHASKSQVARIVQVAGFNWGNGLTPNLAAPFQELLQRLLKGWSHRQKNG
jgi:hypothetical protein